MTRYLLSAAVAALALSACRDAPPATETSAAPAAVDAPVFDAAALPHAQLPGTVVPRAYRIDMRMDPDEETYSGEVEIDVVVNEPVESFFLHAKDMTVTEATLASGPNVIPLTFDAVPLDLAPSGLARLSADEALPTGDATLRMSYETPFNTSLNSAYKVVRGDDAYVVTQMEPIGAREAFPGFDEPRFKIPFTVSITAPEEDFVYSNTPEVSTEELEDGWVRHEFATTRPLPTYLVAFGVGPYDVVEAEDIPANTIRKRPLELRGVTAKGSGEEITYGLAGTEPILRALEEYFGSEYPYEKLDIIAAPDYAFGAMENPGAIVYREYLMLLDEESPLSQKRAYNAVHSHELAHQWFGNLVTPVWWEDIWLNEAFATWMGHKGTAMAYPDGNYDRNTLNAALGAMNIDSLSSTRRVREPLERTENVMDQFDGITYRKGGGVLSMFESYVGEDAFRDGVRLHMSRYADDVATADDFFQSIADGTGNPDVADAMRSFVDQKGVPLVSVEAATESFDDDKGPRTILSIAQSRYAPLGSSISPDQTWQIPVCISYAVEGEREKECVLLTEPSDELSIGGTPDWIMPNADGAAYYRFTLDTPGWETLLSNLDALNTKEVLAAQDSLTAAFRAGEVEPSVYLDGMVRFANHPEYDVASRAGALLGFMHRELPEARGDLAVLVREMASDRYSNIAGRDTVEGELLAPTLAANLARYGGDAELAADFAARGKAYLDGETDAVARNLLSRAMREYAIASPGAAVAPLKRLVREGSSFEKGAAIGALGSIRDDSIAAGLREDALNDTKTFTGRQALSLIGVMVGNEAQAATTQDWLAENFEAFVERVPDVRKPGLPGLASNFCSREERDAAETFFEERAALIPGYERSLAQTLESIELCAAFKAELGKRIVTALAERAE